MANFLSMTSDARAPDALSTAPYQQQGINLTGSLKSGTQLTGQGSSTGGTQPNLGEADILKAQEGAGLLKSRYIDQDPYAQYLERARTGTMAMLGRQSEIDRTQLEGRLDRMGSGVNALRKTGARAGLNTEIAYRYMGAEKGLAELGMASADRAMGAINDYIGAYLNIAGRQQSAYQSYWQRYSTSGSPTIKMGGSTTKAKPVRGLSDDPAGANLGLDTAKSISSPAEYNPYQSGMFTATSGGSELGNEDIRRY